MFSITSKEFNELASYIESNYGIYLKKEKKALIKSRLQKVLIENGFKNFSQYYDSIISDTRGERITTLIDKITTNHTFFMREAKHFHYFRDKVLTYLVKTVGNKDLRIWSAGCSTGEEAYTLAMIIDHFLGKEKILWDTKILATDISNRVLNIAKEGIYQKEKIQTLPLEWKYVYFRKLDGDNYIISDGIKNEVLYRRFNLMERKFPFKRKFHVIFCRNVMIYFNTETRDALVNKFYDSLEYGGYLFIGHSESINREKAEFKYILPSVYRKE